MKRKKQYYEYYFTVLTLLYSASYKQPRTQLPNLYTPQGCDKL